ncbi:MAG: GNAT family N-acetyltransferase [Clostridiales bacterium]
MIRDLLPKDKELFIAMAKEFYASAAVAHNVDVRNFAITFNAAMANSPFIRALIIEAEQKPAGYALLSFTYSNEAGGMVVLIEELYINKALRGKGLASEFFNFLEQEYPLAKRFRLEVRQDNKKAISLYQKLGYQSLDYVQMIKDC